MVMKAYAYAILATAMAAASNLALAGWHSGGGELFTDSQNPWFVQNTSEATYCIEIDAANFGQTLDVARAKIEDAFAYWRREFRVVGPSRENGQDVAVGTQTFRETTCEQNPDIVFQLGTLNDEQAAYLKHPRKVIGEAVRTDYDPVHLKGKGFIYISPETGMHSLEGAGPLGSIVPERWRFKEGILLEIVLIHEIGHVFGLAHISDTLLDPSAPAMLVSYPFGYGLAATSGAPWFFTRDRHHLHADSFWVGLGEDGMDDVREFFGLSASARYLITRAAENDTIELYAYGDNDRNGRLVGSLSSDHSTTGVVSSWISIYLTPAQRVFEMTVPESGRSLDIWAPTEESRTMQYQAVNGSAPRHLATQLKGSEVSMTGVARDGTIMLDMLDMSNWDYDLNRVPARDPGGSSMTKAKAAKINKLRMFRARR
jgi:hypothetical protein